MPKMASTSHLTVALSALSRPPLSTIVTATSPRSTTIVWKGDSLRNQGLSDQR